MKVIKTFYNVTLDTRDGFGRRREFDRQEEYELADYVVNRLRPDAHSTPGRIEELDASVDRIRLSFARLVETLAEKLKLNGKEIAHIVGDYIYQDEEEIKIEYDYIDENDPRFK